jgi:transposase InsO family protein
VKRREFIALISGAAAAWPLAGPVALHAQAAMPVIGYVGTGSREADAFRLPSFHQGLGETGYIEGRNVAIEYRWAEGQNDRLPALMSDLVRRQVKLLKLGFVVAQSTVAKYMARADGNPSGQRWGTFVRNHLPHIAAMDLFVVPTIGFDLLYVLVIVRLARRELVWINVTAHPTAEWIAQQITEAFPWNEAPRYLIHDRDAVYGSVVTRRLRAMGIRDRPIAPGSPWQNCFAERVIGTIRRECVDHVIVLGEQHLRQILKSYADYYNRFRTHRSLAKDSPVSRPVQQTGRITSHALFSGLHHQYARI